METSNLRESYGMTLVELGRTDQRIVVLEADLGKSTRSCLFKDQFPERYFEMGIAEQNMTSTAAGLALVGKIPFVGSFAVFATGRAYDQIRNVVCIPNLPVRICGSSSGISAPPSWCSGRSVGTRVATSHTRFPVRPRS